MAGTASLILLGVFGGLALLGIPLALAITAAAIAALLLVLPFDMALFTSAQKMLASLDSFTLLAVPFFILSGVIMNSGGIAVRLVDFAKLLAGRVPGSLAQTNIAGNMLFGAISGSAIAASTSIGGVMVPMQKREGYDPGFAAAVNIASAPTGMLIPPSTAFIIYSLVAGGALIAALFLAGAVAGLLWGLGLMVLTGIVARRRDWRGDARPSLRDAAQVTWRALPSLMLIVLIIGGIMLGIVTAVEASGIAVIYTMLLAFVIHRTVPVRALPGHPDLHADPSAHRTRGRHGPGAFRRGHGLQPGHRHDHAAGGDRPLRRRWRGQGPGRDGDPRAWPVLPAAVRGAASGDLRAGRRDVAARACGAVTGGGAPAFSARPVRAGPGRRDRGLEASGQFAQTRRHGRLLDLDQKVPQAVIHLVLGWTRIHLAHHHLDADWVAHPSAIPCVGSGRSSHLLVPPDLRPCRP